MKKPAVAEGRLAGDAMVLATHDVRRQLKIIAAVTGSTMKDVLARLVALEYKRVAPAVKE
jgi:hypothetical protein